MHAKSVNPTLRSSNAYLCLACRLRPPYDHPQTRRQQHAATQPPNPAQDARARLYGILSTTESPSEDEAGRVNHGIKNKSPQPAESETAASTPVDSTVDFYLTALTRANLVKTKTPRPYSRSTETATASS